MFCFISSLRSPNVSDNWGRVCELFERTAASVFNQSSEDFRFIVTCHQPPTLRRKFDDRLEFLIVDYPEPRRRRVAAFADIEECEDAYPKLRVEYDWSWRPSGMSADYPYMARDKLAKLLRAMDRVRELNAEYVMSLDADDLVHRRIVAHVNEHPDVDGWYIEHGWGYSYGNRWIETLDHFNQICGSCNILSRRFYAFPGDEERQQAVDTQWFRNGHTDFVRGFRGMGANICPLPFRGAIYITQHGENFSRIRQEHVQEVNPQRPRSIIRRLAGSIKRSVSQVRNHRPCGRKLRSEFSLSCTRLN